MAGADPTSLRQLIAAMQPGDRRAHPKHPGVTIRKLGGGDVRYDVRFSTAKGRTTRSFAKLADARAFLLERDRLRVHERTGLDVERGTETLTAHINDWWATYAKKHLEDSTRETHRQAIELHIAPRIGHLQLRQVTPDVVYQFLSALQDQTGPSQVQRVMSVLSGILKRAVERGRIDANPCRDITVPKAKRAGIIRPFEVDDIERCRARIDAADQRLYVSLLAYAGLRPAEARGLQRQHVRLDKGSLDIVARGAGTERRAGTKAGAGRAVPILEALRADLIAAGVDRLAPGDHILRGPAGAPWTTHMHRNFGAREWRQAQIDCALPVQRLYLLRHTCASLRIAEQRWTATEIARMMGHDARTLDEYYAHLLREASGKGPLDVERSIRAARDKHGTHPAGVELPDLVPVRLTITATDPYGASHIDRYRRLLTEAGLTHIEITEDPA